MVSTGWIGNFDPIAKDIIDFSAAQDYFSGYFQKENVENFSFHRLLMSNPFLDTYNFSTVQQSACQLLDGKL